MVLSDIAGRVSSGPVQPLSARDPREIGGYEIRGRIGSGGMGAVYLGATRSGRDLAVKVIHPERTDEHEFRARFRREVSAATRVRSHGTAAVIDFDVEAPMPWLATEYVTGPTLARVVAEFGPLPEDAVRELVAGVGEALQAVHRHGLVHRDVKPGNIILGPDGPVLIDLGIVAEAEATSLTTTGLQPGTPQYMSPEQAKGEPVGPATDVWSLGAVAYLAATGRGPFGTGTLATMTYRIVHDEPAVVDLPYALRPLIAACLAKDPAARPTPSALVRSAVGPAPGADLPMHHPAPIPTVPEPDEPTHLGAAAAPGIGAPVVAAAPWPAASPVPQRDARRRSRRGLVVGLVTAGAVVLGGGGAAAWFAANSGLREPACTIAWEPATGGSTWGRCPVDESAMDPDATYHWKWVFADADTAEEATLIYEYFAHEDTDVILDPADSGKDVWCVVTAEKNGETKVFRASATVPYPGDLQSLTRS